MTQRQWVTGCALSQKKFSFAERQRQMCSANLKGSRSMFVLLLSLPEKSNFMFPVRLCWKTHFMLALFDWSINSLDAMFVIAKSRVTVHVTNALRLEIFLSGRFKDYFSKLCVIETRFRMINNPTWHSIGSVPVHLKYNVQSSTRAPYLVVQEAWRSDAKPRLHEVHTHQAHQSRSKQAIELPIGV